MICWWALCLMCIFLESAQKNTREAFGVQRTAPRRATEGGSGSFDEWKTDVVHCVIRSQKDICGIFASYPSTRKRAALPLQHLVIRTTPTH